MFNFIKSLFGDRASAESVSKSSNPHSQPAPIVAPPSPQRAAPAPVTPRPAAVHPNPHAAPRPAPPPAADLPAGPYLELPLAPITERLAEPLRSRIHRRPTHGDVVKVSLSATLEQLPKGAVRIPFRMLKQGSPPGVFAGTSDLDEVQVDLPLAEIVSRLKPSYLARRPDQKRLAPGEDLPSVFASRTSKTNAPAAHSSPRHTDELGSSRILTEAAGKLKPLPADPFGTPAPAPPPPAPKPVPQAHAPQRLPDPMPRVSFRDALRPPSATAPAQEPGKPTHPREPEAAPTEGVKVPLVSLARNWPEALRREILGSHLSASIQIPFQELEAAMKRGQALFSWKQLRLWMHPKPSSALTEHDSTSLELPLSVVVPLFLARRNEVSHAPKKRVIAEPIPDVFQARKTAEVSPAVPELPDPPAESTTPAPAPVQGQAATDRKPAAGTSSAGSTPDELTLARSSALPTQTVQRACHLSGVAGALLATPDGLVIASQLPPTMNVETAAGLIPQIFTRISQYTRELKLGEPRQVEILVENVPLHIIKTPSAYFAVLGKSAETLPKLQLNALATQLSPRTH